jgi:hypothetical protein
MPNLVINANSVESADTWAVNGYIELIPKTLVIWKRRQSGKEGYYWRCLIPKQYRDLNGGRRYLNGALGTADENTARTEAFGKYYGAKGKWEHGLPLSQVTVANCINRYLADIKAKNPSDGQIDNI